MCQTLLEIVSDFKVPVNPISAIICCLAILQLLVLYFPLNICFHSTGYFSHTAPNLAQSDVGICNLFVWKNIEKCINTKELDAMFVPQKEVSTHCYLANLPMLCLLPVDRVSLS